MSFVDDYQSEWAAHQVNSCRTDVCVYCEAERIGDKTELLIRISPLTIAATMNRVKALQSDQYTSYEEALDELIDEYSHKQATIPPNPKLAE